MTEQEIEAVAALRLAKKSNTEIGQILGFSYEQVVRRIARARQRGLIPPKTKAEPRQAARDFVKNYSKSMGHVGDVMVALSKDQQRWLMGEATKLGCQTIAEYLTELVRDEHARFMGDDQK